MYDVASSHRRSTYGNGAKLVASSPMHLVLFLETETAAAKCCCETGRNILARSGLGEDIICQHMRSVIPLSRDVHRRLFWY